MTDEPKRGVQGPQGVQGIQGIQGDEGPTGGEKGDKGDKGEPGHLPRNVTLSFWVVVAVAFAVTSVMGYQLKQVRDLSQSNKQLFIDSQAQRKVLVRGFKRADVRLCRTQELLKAQNRAEARRSFRRLDETLALLQLEKSPTIIAAARAEKERKLKLNAPHKGGCGKLPPKITKVKQESSDA